MAYPLTLFEVNREFVIAKLLLLQALGAD